MRSAGFPGSRSPFNIYEQPVPATAGSEPTEASIGQTGRAGWTTGMTKRPQAATR